MLDKVRPGEWVSPDRGVALDWSRASSNTKNPRHLQRRRWYPTKSSRLDYDWRSSWRPIGKIATETVLPKIAEQRERDRKIRAELGLPPVDWEVAK